MSVSTPASIVATGSAAVAGADLRDIRRQGIKRFLLMLPTWGAVLSLLWVSAALKVLSVDAVTTITLVSLFTQGVFFALLYSGVMVRSKDPLLAYANVLLNICLAALAFALMDRLRSIAVLWLSVIIVFDMRRLPRRQMVMAAWLCLATMLLAMLNRAHWHLVGYGLFDEMPTILSLAAVLPVLVAVSAQARKVRLRQTQQKEQMQQALRQLHQLAIRDALTGLYNRRHILGLLEDEWRRWRRVKRPFCVAILDIDFFKRVNDRHGHAAGDAVLQAFAKLGAAHFPGLTDVLARWGGEEFLLFQPQHTQAQTLAALMGLREAVHAHDWTQYAEGLAVTFSAGLCEFRPGYTVDQALELADQALYRAKHAGRDCIHIGEGQPAHDPQAGGRAPMVASSRRRMATPSLMPVLSAPFVAASPASIGGKADQGMRQSEPAQSWRVWLMGRDERLRAHLQMCLLASCVYFVGAAGVLFYSLPAQWLTMQQAGFIVSLYMVGAIVPSAVVRSGLTAHLKDPSFVFIQLIWAGLAASISYGVMPPSGPASLQILCLCVVFGFSNLQPKEARHIGWYYIGLLVGALALRWGADVQGLNLRTEAIEVVMTCLVLRLLTLQSHNFSLTRERVRAEKRELAEATDKVNRLMRHDALTGLYNRQHMQDLLARECDRHQRSEIGFCVALVDLDHFKRINDNHGHRTGDDALIGFAKAAQAVLRETDVICRWGGEEFLVLLADTMPGPNAVLALNRLREHVAAQRFCEGLPDLQLTFSAGMAEHRRGEPIESTVERADRALYEAKAAGRNACRLG